MRERVKTRRSLHQDNNERPIGNIVECSLDLNETQRAIWDECEGLAEMLIAKNAAYGNSALEPLRVFSKAPAGEQIRVRLDDKLSRLMRGEGAGEDVELDLMGYLVLLRVQRRLAEGPLDESEVQP